MIIVVASIAAILTVPLTGRSLAPLAKTVACGGCGWCGSASGCKLLITMLPRFPNWLGQPLHLFTFAPVGGLPVEQSPHSRGVARGARGRR